MPLDRLLEPYGGIGAIARAEQPSHRFIEDEIRQNQTMATTIPPIFLGVAAFLLNVVLGRLVTTQREQIAAMKAVGYANAAIGLHYLKFVLVIVLTGTVVGTFLGAGLGRLMLTAYAPFVRMPHLDFHMTAWIPLLAAVVSVLAAVAGALGALRGVAALAPAEAMRPPAPRVYHRTLAERAGLHAWLGPRRLMATRNVSGRPMRALLTIAAIACAAAIVVLSRWSHDAVGFMLDAQFRLAERADATVVFTDPVSRRGVREIAALPGVLRAEGQRVVPVQLRAGHRTYRTGILGLPADAELRQLLDANMRRIAPPPEGMLLTERLGERLGVKAGDEILVEVREGERLKRTVVVAGLVNDMIGMSGYMDTRALARLLREDERVSLAAVAVDPNHAEQLYRPLEGDRTRRDGDGKGGRSACIRGHDGELHTRLHRDSHDVRGRHRGRGRLQHGTDRPPGAGLGARQPARPRLHARRGVAHPADRDRRSAGRGVAAGHVARVSGVPGAGRGCTRRRCSGSP